MARRNIPGARIVITGASQGIGRALALAAVQRGAHVLATARTADLLRELIRAVDVKVGSLQTVPADITQSADRSCMVQAARELLGGVDVLVNNAGIGATGHFMEAAPKRLRQIMEVNFFGLTETTRVFLPLLIQGRDPAIVNISSVAGKRAIPARSEYSASKFAVQGFSESLRAELAKDGIDVLLVCPGLTQTNFSHNMLEQKARLPMDHLRGMTAERVAEATLHALERRRREVVLTRQANLICLVARFLPRLADRIAAKRVRELFPEEIAARRRARADRTRAP